MRYSLRPLLAAAALACAATPTSAQEIVFRQIPWNAPRDTVRARLEAQGYRYLGVRERGALTFVRPDSAYVMVMLRGVEHPIGFVTGDAARGERADARFRSMADSLERRLGNPVDRRPDAVRWEAGLTSVTVYLRTYRNGQRAVESVWQGPGWLDETGGDPDGPAFADLPAGYIAVSQNRERRVAVDTSAITRLTPGALRARYRVDYPDPIDDDLGGRYDAIVYGMDFDCPGGRTRMYSRTTLLRGRRHGTSSAQGLPWRRVTGGSEEARALDGVCRARGRSAAVAARPAASRTFEALPAGWRVVDQDEESRTSVDSAAIAPRGAGVYSLVMRIEWGRMEPSPYGQVDALRGVTEVDCRARRYRIMHFMLELHRRDVHVTPVPPAQAAWNAAADKPGIAEACRLAGEPWQS